MLLMLLLMILFVSFLLSKSLGISLSCVELYHFTHIHMLQYENEFLKDIDLVFSATVSVPSEGLL